MPADFSKPVLTDNYNTGMLAAIRAHIAALACMLAPSEAAVGTLANTPTGARRFNDAGGYFERWNGSAWSQMTVNISGQSGTAAKLTAPRTIAATGDATWSVNFDGSGNASGTLTLANSGVSAGTYRSVTVNAKGIVTGGANPTTLAGYGISDAQPLDADLTAIAALTGTTGLLRKTAANTWSLDTTAYAPILSPALTGTPTAPTPATTDASTRVATTAHVAARIAQDAPTKTGGGASGSWDITANAAAKLSSSDIGTAPHYAARAWVSFDGTGAVTIRGKGNVSSITDNGTGTYTINFETPMPDDLYATKGSARRGSTDTNCDFAFPNSDTYSQYAVKIRTQASNNYSPLDADLINVVVYR